MVSDNWKLKKNHFKKIIIRGPYFGGWVGGVEEVSQKTILLHFFYPFLKSIFAHKSLVMHIILEE